jgi:hypothetical protein
VLLRTRLTAQTVVPYGERLQFSKLVYDHIRQRAQACSASLYSWHGIRYVMNVEPSFSREKGEVPSV